MLLRRWERARRGDGQLVLIIGEPGLGKSRLMEEFQTRLRDTPHTWVEWSCSQLLQNTPLHPIAEWGRERFGGADVPAEQRIAELESTLTQIKLDPIENVPLLATLLAVPLPKERMPTLAPEDLRRRQLGALTAILIASARLQPMVLALEDLHWADPSYARRVARHRRKRRAGAVDCPRQQHAQNSGCPGGCARTTARFRSRRSTAIRCGIWSATLRRTTCWQRT